MTALFLPAAAQSAVTEAEAARLDRELTPVGAQRAGNETGTIPAWDGGLATPPPCFKGPGSRYCDPWPDERPGFAISAANLAQYEDRLSPGQVALLQAHPDSLRMPVYATRRSFANPGFVYAATRANATRARLDGAALVGAATGVPFPLPASGLEVIWNHRTRYRDAGVQRWNNQFAVAASGDYNRTQSRESLLFAYSAPAARPEALDNILYYALQEILAPPRLEGALLLVHETLDHAREARRAWQYSPGQKRLRRAPNIAHETPAIGADGLRTLDQGDGFNGATDRYDWTLVGKQELYVPANSYRLHDGSLRYDDIIGRRHLNPDLLRYELRRVWVVEATLRAGLAHPYRRRRFYVDEDGWQIRLVDLYDAGDRLWRVQELHSVIAYDKPYELPVCETVYDLEQRRYLAQGLNNEDPETVSRAFTVEAFEPGTVSRLAKK